MPQPQILIIEDDKNWQQIFQRCLRGKNYDIETTQRLGAALTLLEKQTFDVIITDLNMLGGEGEVSGFSVLEQATVLNPKVNVIVVTGQDNVDYAVRSMADGAYNYVTKERGLVTKLPIIVESALDWQLLKQGVGEERQIDNLDTTSNCLIANSSSMQPIFEQIDKAINSNFNVLIYGETGTGKQLIAQTIHRLSQRKNAPFVTIDCGRLSESLLESLLFGYEADALFGLDKAQPGKFELAEGGTIFLDSLGDLDIQLQSRLLSVVRDRTVQRVGGNEKISVDVRIIASTDKNLKAMVSERRFHRELFEVFNKFVISVPPLRERKDSDDIPALAAMFLRRHRAGRHIRLSSEAISLLHQYDYPGNIPELESAIRYALKTTSDDVIYPRHLSPEIRDYKPPKRGQPRQEESKDPKTIMRVCPLNLGACNKKEEIIRLYSPRRVYVNIPYSPEYKQNEQVIRSTLEKYGLVPVLSKDLLEPVVLLCNICKLIQTCKYGISDISTSESDVLYELGLMHANGVHCTILRQRLSALSADIQGMFYLEYTNPETMAERLSHWIEDQVVEAKVKPSIFVSYNHTDETEKEQLLSHLGVLQYVGLIDVWSDDRIRAGSDTKSEINRAIAQAKVAILLITANFLSSEFLRDEIATLLKRREQEGLIIFPVIAKACAWKSVDWLAKMNVRPREQKPVWSEGGANADEYLAAIAEEIAEVARKESLI